MPQNDLLKDLQNKRVGLVLCGGGFKGAYQIGVWRALSKIGIKRFHAIAGTSVGALNAVLIANDDFKTAKQVWKESTVMTFSPKRSFLYIAGYSLLLGPIVFALLLVIPAIILRDEEQAVVTALCLGLACTSFVSNTFVRIRSLDRLVFLRIHPEGLFALSLLLLSGLLIFSYPTDKMSAFAMLAGIVAGFPCGWIGLWILELGQRTGRFLSSEGLLEELRNSVDLRTIKARVEHLFVTTARGCSFTDPFRMNIKMVPAPGGPTYETAEWPGFSNTWTPSYHDLCLLDDKEQAIELLRLSSALPVVLPGATSANNEMLVDGGLADNMPLLPVLGSGVDFIIIVCLDPMEGRKYQSVDQLDEYLFKVFLKQWLPGLSHDKSEELYHKWRRYSVEVRGSAEYDLRHLVPDRPQMHGMQGCIIAPDRPLPLWNFWGIRFITGTLNWRRDVRRKWMILGYRETRRKVRSSTIRHFINVEQ